MRKIFYLAIGIFVLLLAMNTLNNFGVNEQDTTKILQNEGYTNIHLTGYDAFGCADGDVFSTGFTATNSNGKEIRGVVCGGYLKGYTIRIHP